MVAARLQLTKVILIRLLHGIQLISSTPYYFTIYPYTNSGTNIDYKVTPAAPTAMRQHWHMFRRLAAWTFDATPAAAKHTHFCNC